MDAEMEIRVNMVVIGIEEDGPKIDALSPDSETEAISKRWSIPVDNVTAVKYLVEHGPVWGEMIDNAWNDAFEFDRLNDPTEQADDTICPYNMCDGYESESESHTADCPYRLALELVSEWRQDAPSLFGE